MIKFIYLILKSMDKILEITWWSHYKNSKNFNLYILLWLITTIHTLNYEGTCILYFKLWRLVITTIIVICDKSCK